MPQRPRPQSHTTQRQSMRQQYGYLIGSVLALSMCTVGLVYWQQLKPDGLTYFKGSFEQALDQAHLGDRLCFVKFESEFCYPCQQLDLRLKRTPSFAAAVGGEYLIYQVDPFNSYTGGRELSRQYHIQQLPTVLITDADGLEITRLEGLADVEALEDFLQEQAVLRVAPAQPEVTRTNYSLGADLDSSAQLPKQHFGLTIGEYPDFITARRAALKRKRSWNQAIWIQPKAETETCEVVLGCFDERREARLTKKFLALWEDEETEVVPLRPLPLTIPQAPQGFTQPSEAP